jgi:hypothetical protein
MATSIDVAEARAQLFHAALVRGPRPDRIEDLTATLSQFAQWRPSILAAAVADLVADGRITEDPAGNLRVTLAAPKTAPPAPPPTPGIGLPEVRG